MSIWKEEFVKLEEKYNAALIGLDKTKKDLKAWKRKAEILKSELKTLAVKNDLLEANAIFYEAKLINDKKELISLREAVEKQREELVKFNNTTIFQDEISGLKQELYSQKNQNLQLKTQLKNEFLADVQEQYNVNISQPMPKFIKPLQKFFPED